MHTEFADARHETIGDVATEEFVGSLSCHLINHYYQKDKDAKIVKAILIGGLTTVITLGAMAEVSGAVVAGMIVDGALAVVAVRGAYQTCESSGYDPRSLVNSPG